MKNRATKLLIIFGFISFTISCFNSEASIGACADLFLNVKSSSVRLSIEPIKIDERLIQFLMGERPNVTIEAVETNKIDRGTIETVVGSVTGKPFGYALYPRPTFKLYNSDSALEGWVTQPSKGYLRVTIDPESIFVRVKNFWGIGYKRIGYPYYFGVTSFLGRYVRAQQFEARGDSKNIWQKKYWTSMVL